MRLICNREWCGDDSMIEATYNAVVIDAQELVQNFKADYFNLPVCSSRGRCFHILTIRTISSAEMRCAWRASFNVCTLFYLLTTNYGAECRHVSGLGKHFRRNFTWSRWFVFTTESFHLKTVQLPLIKNCRKNSCSRISRYYYLLHYPHWLFIRYPLLRRKHVS